MERQNLITKESMKAEYKGRPRCCIGRDAHVQDFFLAFQGFHQLSIFTIQIIPLNYENHEKKIPEVSLTAENH